MPRTPGKWAGCSSSSGCNRCRSSRRAAGARGPPRLPGRTTFSLLLFSAELRDLLEAGLSLVEAFEALLEKETSPLSRAVLERLTGDLREGLRFSAALARQPDVFPPLYVGIVRAAEGTSDLPRALSRYIDYQTRLDTVRNKMVSAAIYPAILLVVGAGVTFFLMGYVVPRFSGVYQGSGRSLPWLSQSTPRLGPVRRPALRRRFRVPAGCWGSALATGCAVSFVVVAGSSS